MPDDIKYDLHVLLVEHGKKCSHCAKGSAVNKNHTVGREQCPLAASRRASPAAAGVLQESSSKVEKGKAPGRR